MTDNEIIKSLECCISNIKCHKCSMFGRHDCMNDLMRSSLKLINRQKVDIELLKADKIIAETREKAATELLKDKVRSFDIFKKEIKSVAIKEFAEKFKEKVLNDFCYGRIPFIKVEHELYKLVKEMTEVQE